MIMNASGVLESSDLRLIESFFSSASLYFSTHFAGTSMEKALNVAFTYSVGVLSAELTDELPDGFADEPPDELQPAAKRRQATTMTVTRIIERFIIALTSRGIAKRKHYIFEGERLLCLPGSRVEVLSSFF